MGLFSAFGDPTKSARKYTRATIKDFNDTRAQTDPFFSNLMQGGNQASSLYGDFLGLNGAGAQQGAYDGYTNSPAFDFQFDQGTRAIDQSGAARGMSQSGEQLKALQGFGQGLYNQGINTYLDRLNGQQNAGIAGANGLTQNSQILSGLYNTMGNQKTQGMQGGLSNIAGGLGTAASFFGGGGSFGNLFGS